MKYLRTSVIAVAAVGALLVGPAAIGMEGDAAPSDRAAAVAEAVTAVAPDAGTTVAVRPTSGGLIAEGRGDGVTVELPHRSDGGLTLSAGDSDANLVMELPPEAGVGLARTASHGTVVYLTRDDAVSVAVQPLQDGVRIQTVLGDESAPTSYTYDLPADVTPVPNADGSVELLGSAGPIGFFAAPWAKDAHGRDVFTHYVIDGASVVQVVEPTADAAYPIVADPTVSFGWGVYYHYNRAETKTIASYGTGGAAVAGAICATFGGGVGLAVCGSAAGAIIYQAGVAENSSPRRCLVIRHLVPGSIIIPGTYRDRRCA